MEERGGWGTGGCGGNGDGDGGSGGDGREQEPGSRGVGEPGSRGAEASFPRDERGGRGLLRFLPNPSTRRQHQLPGRPRWFQQDYFPFIYTRWVGISLSLSLSLSRGIYHPIPQEGAEEEEEQEVTGWCNSAVSSGRHKNPFPSLLTAHHQVYPQHYTTN